MAHIQKPEIWASFVQPTMSSIKYGHIHTSASGQLSKHLLSTYKVYRQILNHKHCPCPVKTKLNPGMKTCFCLWFYNNHVALITPQLPLAIEE